MTSPIDMMAVVTDKTTRTAEALEVDCIQVVSFQLNYVGRLAVFIVAFGGCDSTGKFHVDPARKDKLAQVVINDPLFKELFETADGNPRRDLSQEFLDTLFVEHVIPAADKLCWTFENVEFQMNGKSVFRKTKHGNPGK